MVVLPYDMSVRNFAESVLFAPLHEDKQLDIVALSRNNTDVDTVDSSEGRLSWQQLLRPFHKNKFRNITFFKCFRYAVGDLCAAIGHYVFLCLTHRFNLICGFKGFKVRLKQSKSMRRIAIKEGLPLSQYFGFPFAKSKIVFKFIKHLYFMGWQRHPFVKDQFEQINPDLLVITHLQSSFVTPYVLEAQRRKITVVGFVGSWDQPTTKGPIMPGLSMIAVQNKQVAQDLINYHHYPSSKIKIIGWTAFDNYATRQGLQPREAFLAKLGLSQNSRYIFLGAYSQRLGRHEPALCDFLIQKIKAGDFGPDITLFIRTHPLDNNWQGRFGGLHNSPTCIVDAGQLGDQEYLTNLLYHANLVLSSAGTINLDALALDTPSAAIMIEDEKQPYFDRAARHFDMEHISNTIDGDGIFKLTSIEEVFVVCQKSLADRDSNKLRRQSLRDRVLSPFDGQSSRRTAQWIVDCAR